MPNTDKIIFLPQLQRYDEKIKNWADNRFLTDVVISPLTPATASTLGGVKVGNGLSVTSDGILSNNIFIVSCDLNTSSATFEQINAAFTSGKVVLAVFGNGSVGRVSRIRNDLYTAYVNASISSKTITSPSGNYEVPCDAHSQYVIWDKTNGYSVKSYNMFWDIGTTLEYLKNGSYGKLDVKDGGITSTKIANGAITAAKLASNAVTTDKITDGAITSVKLASGAVTADKIADGAITADKLASGVGGGMRYATSHPSGNDILKFELPNSLELQLNTDSAQYWTAGLLYELLEMDNFYVIVYYAVFPVASSDNYSLSNFVSAEIYKQGSGKRLDVKSPNSTAHPRVTHNYSDAGSTSGLYVNYNSQAVFIPKSTSAQAALATLLPVQDECEQMEAEVAKLEQDWIDNTDETVAVDGSGIPITIATKKTELEKKQAELEKLREDYFSKLGDWKNEVQE